MRYRERILAGTAIGIMMSAAPLAARAMEAAPVLPAVAPVAADGMRTDAPVILAQTDGQPVQPEDQELLQQQQQGAEDDTERQQRRSERRQQRQEERAQRKQERAGRGDTREQEQAQPEQQPAEQRATEPRSQRRQAEEQPAEDQPVKRRAEPQNAEEGTGEPRRQRAREQQQQEQQRAGQEQQDEQRQRAREERRQERQRAREERRQERQRAREERQEEGQPAGEQQRTGQEQREERQRERAGEQQQEEQQRRAREERQRTRDRQQQADEKQQQGDEQRADEEQQEEQRRAREERRQRRDQATGERERPRVREAEEGERQQQLDEKARRALDNQKPLPENAAPVLDSQKGREQGGATGQALRTQRNQPAGEQAGEGQDVDIQGAEQAPPQSDRAAQRDININIGEIEPVTAEEGRRIDRAQWRELRRQRRDARVINQVGDRTIIEFNNNIIVQGDDHDRIGRHARDVYYEVLPDDRRREVVIRPDGSRVITIRNSYGDIIRRTRVLPDGQEYLLVYAGPRHDRWHDPAEDLPPLQLTIPVSEYILEADAVRDADVYYEFLEQPPVAPVQELYTIDQVRYSARVRDTMRRVDLDTINFETGSAEIAPGEMEELGALADAMLRIIDDDPAETFLIEGHTDAVGSEESNLALSDERAEAVADALTQEYDIPPENMFTQGYGEEYLKIETEGASRANRRVAVRRITPLVTPVASAEQ